MYNIENEETVEVRGPGFYKVDGENVLYAPNFVLNKDYELKKENLETLVLPVDGWNWYNSEEDIV